jgi:hypothetical protein
MPAAMSTAIRDRMTMLMQLRDAQNESDWQHSAALPQQQYWLLLPCSGALRQQHTTSLGGACGGSQQTGLSRLESWKQVSTCSMSCLY